MSTQLNYEIKNLSQWIGESYHIARGKRWNYKQLGFPDAAQIVPAKKENGSLTRFEQQSYSEQLVNKIYLIMLEAATY